MPLRQSARLLAAAGALLVAAPLLSSCGFDYATDRDYTPGPSTNNRDALVDVLGAAVVSAQDGSGTFIASFANNEQDEAASVDAITAKTREDGESIEVADFDPIEIPAGGLVSLADDDGGIVLTGTVAAGDFISMSFTLGDGETVELDVPVYPPCNEYVGLDQSAEGPEGLQECDVVGESPSESESSEG